jgi:ribosome hibernation promoting factor
VQVRVTGRNVDVPDGVREAVESKLEHLSKIVPGMELGDVVFKEERNPRIEGKDVVEIGLEGHGHHLRCKATGTDQLHAVDKACDKLGKQLRKLKTKLHRRHHPNPKRAERARGAVAEVEPATEPDLTERPVVKTKSFELVRMYASEAVARMEMLDHSFFLFCDAESGRPSVVYERDDGTVGLIEGA